jgi:hypothetical protein
MASIPSSPDHLLVPVAQQQAYAKIRLGNLPGKPVKFGNR